jgi:hypothetical protein
MTTQDWQAAVDSSLVRRLMRPLVQPGAIESQIGDSILARTERMTNHLPLLVQFAQRQVGIFQPEQIPIVYAQPSSSIQVVQAYPKTTTEPLTIVQATLISNSTLNDSSSNLTTLNDSISNSTNLNVREVRQEHFNHYTTSTNVRIGEVRQESEFLPQKGSADAIAVSNPPPIVYAQNVSHEFDRSTHTFIVRPQSLAKTNLQNRTELRDLGGKSFLQATPASSQKSDLSASTSPPIVAVTSSQKSDLPGSTSPPIIPVRTGTEAASPAATWQTRTPLNETATTIPIVFAQSNPATASTQATSRTPSELSQLSEFPSSIFPPSPDTFSSSPPPLPPINLDTLTSQVERKLLRRLVVESERRGQTRWR